MDIGYVPPLPLGPLAAAGRDLAQRMSRIPLAPWPQQLYPTIAILVALAGAWLVNSHDWSLDRTQLFVAACSAAVVAAVALCVGWATQPENLRRWTLWAFLAAGVSALPCTW